MYFKVGKENLISFRIFEQHQKRNGTLKIKLKWNIKKLYLTLEQKLYFSSYQMPMLCKNAC